jgi:3-dehydroquinate synthase
MLEISTAEQILRVLDGLQMEIYHPALDWRDVAGARRVLEGLDEFREHLGGELTVLLLTGIGKGIEVHELDEDLLGVCIDELRVRYGSRKLLNS